MNLLAGNPALLGPQIESRLFYVQLVGQFFDRQQHVILNRGSLATPPAPLSALASARQRWKWWLGHAREH